ncbi:MAG: hypothetical protein U1E45_04615 [Geminicoccaceae bacterium]
MRVSVLLLACLILAGQARAEALLSTATEMPFDYKFDTAPKVADGAELVVVGQNPGKDPVTVVIRLDDAGSWDYGSRINDERVVPPGKFTLRTPMSGLLESSGRAFDLPTWKRLIVFAPNAATAPVLTSVRIDPGLKLPAGTVALDFGPPDSPLMSGFQRVGPDDPRLSGSPAALRRPYSDALIGDGINGVTGIKLSLPAGSWRITIWTEDVGGWERLPPWRERRYRIGGRTVFEEHIDGPKWVQQRYLAGRTREAGRDSTPWDAYGKWRGAPFTADVVVDKDPVQIELAGTAYVAGLLAEPIGSGAGEKVEAARKQRFNETWRVISRPGPTSTTLAMTPIGSIVTAPGVVTFGETRITSPVDDPAPSLQIDPPRRGTRVLGVRPRFGMWRLERPRTASTGLELHDNFLRGDIVALTLRRELPRRLVLEISASGDAPAGIYRGKVTLTSKGRKIETPLTVEVLPIALPQAPATVGLYLEEQPQLSWFVELGALRPTAMACDLTQLRRLGLTGLAAPLPTPTSTEDEPFLAVMDAVAKAGFTRPVLAYAPVKRLLGRMSPADAGKLLAGLQSSMRAHGFVPPIWAIADEPSNVGNSPGNVDAVADALHSAMPTAKLAGQLNARDDRRFLDDLDIAIVNSGFGVDYGDIVELRTAGVIPWFYNMGDPRPAAGFYLWRTAAEGYLQWHARMPTADPFDPTDGREADVQYLYPTDGSCPAVPDIDAAMIDLVEGITDLRWLAWLDAKAATDMTARRLVQTLRDAVPRDWTTARTRTAELPAMRARIVDLARHLL